MTEIPFSIIDKETWDILPGKIDIKQHPEKSHTILILLLRRRMIPMADSIMSYYLQNHKDYIRELFKKTNTSNTSNTSNTNMNIRLAILEYIGHQKPINVSILMKKFNIKFSYTIFRCSIKADNFALVSLLIKKGYPFQIKKHNDEIYHIVNDMLNMMIMTESVFNMLLNNIIHATKNGSYSIKFSLYTYIRILKKGYYKICKKIESYVDINIWNGKELQDELIYLKDNMHHLYDHVKQTFSCIR